MSFYFKNLWRWKCSISEVEVEKSKSLNINDIKKSQCNPKFEELRTNRMIMGFFRYGFVKKEKQKYDNIGSAIIRLQKYQKTGNSECLVDVANLCMIEFTQENHDDFHFNSVDDGEHTKEV